MALGWHLRPGKDIMSYEAVQKGFQHIPSGEWMNGRDT